jgi:type IV pilus assembly protein PilY1
VHSTSTTAAQRPIQQWCQRSYAFLVTDGRPTYDRSFNRNEYLRDYDGDCKGPLAANCVGGTESTAIANWDRKTARMPYESVSGSQVGSDYLDDVAKALFDVDLRPDLLSPNPTTRPKKNNLLTYTIGFADEAVENDPLLINTAAQGGGLFLNAADGTTLTAAFKRVITDAFAKDAAAAAVAVANAQITLNNVGYASSYNSGSWYGDLAAYSLDTSTGLQTGADIWSLREKLAAQTPNSRKIATFNGTAGVAFRDTLAYTGKPASLTGAVINYLRGDRTGEGTTYRQRQDVLGDIINAEPVVVTYAGNVPIVFQGANDGMLHVVDGRTDAAVATRGQELWAYVPKLLHDSLAELSKVDYTHRYYIDGTPAAADVTGLGSMSKLLVGGLGKGGRGYYALDISSYSASSESDVASKVKWEVSPSGMGYSFGTPLIVKVGGTWRVVVASGFDASVSGRVWVLNAADGSIVKTIDTGVTGSGLAHLGKLANVAPDADTSYVWGADNLGNVWRFDITGTGSSAAVRIASLVDDGGSLAQPVTSAPEVSQVSGSTTRFVVQLGTGRYLADADVPGTGANAEATQRQSIYGLVDDVTLTASAALITNLRGTNGSNCPAGGGNGSLVCQALTYNSGTDTYQATTHSVDLGSGRGWYVDLPTSSTPAGRNMINGRIVSKPALTSSGTLTLTVNIPTNVQCDPGGRSWFLALNGATGGAVVRNVGGNTYYDAGYFLGYALASRPVIVTTSAGKRALIRMSDKSVRAPEVPEPASTAAQWRRIYWRPVN